MVSWMSEIENPIISGGHPQNDTYQSIILGYCTNAKCNEDIYSGEGYEYNGQLFCGTHCIGEHLVNEGQAIELSVRY